MKPILRVVAGNIFQKKLLETASELVAAAVNRALTDVERGQQLVLGATTEIAESFLSIEATIQEYRQRLEVLSNLMQSLESDELEAVSETVRYALTEQIEATNILLEGVENRVSQAMRALQFEDMTSQILTAALGHLARLAEVFQVAQQRSNRDGEEIIQGLHQVIEDFQGSNDIPQQSTMTPGKSKVF